MAATKPRARRKALPEEQIPFPREAVTRDALLDIAGSAIARAQKKPDVLRVNAVLAALRAVAQADAITTPRKENCITRRTIIMIERDVLGMEGSSEP